MAKTPRVSTGLLSLLLLPCVLPGYVSAQPANSAVADAQAQQSGIVYGRVQNSATVNRPKR